MKRLPFILAVLLVLGWTAATTCVTVVTQAQATQLEVLRVLEK